VTVHLADEAVDIDRQPAVAGTGASLPGARQALGEQAVQLTHVPERKRTQKRPQRRRRGDPAAQQPARATRAQHVAVIDAVGTQRHRVDQRHHLAARVARPEPLRPQPHQPLRQRLDPQPRRHRRRQHQPRVRDHPLVIERDLDAVQSDRSIMLHHQDDLLTQDATAQIGRFFPAREVILRPAPDGTPPTLAAD
jgi:hypothetical protein